VKEFAETDGTAALLLELVELGVPLLPQAAMTRAALPTTAVRPTLLVIEYNETTSLVGGHVKTWTTAMAASETSPRPRPGIKIIGGEELTMLLTSR